ncbi:MAG: hypothetical protein O3C23_01275 [bacterium]|nr:hypothetical protein [bacterium]
MKTKHYLLVGFLLVALLIAFAGRLIPHPANFTPIGALALFAGMYLVPLRGISRRGTGKHWFWLFLPLGVMFVTDLVIGFYDTKLMLVVYGSFLFYGIFGLLIKDKKNVGAITLATLAGSFLFYLSTNFAVWAFSPMYAPTMEGLMLSYTMGLPFLKYTLLGDLFFVGVFVGAYQLATIALLHKERWKESLVRLIGY